jgi:hypothetical protein
MKNGVIEMPRETNYIPNEYNTASEYLTVPFMKHQEHMNDDNLNTFNILIGRTGQGKSYGLWNVSVPYYVEDRKKLIIVSAPMTEIFDSHDVIDEWIHDNIDDHYRVSIIDMRYNKDSVSIRNEFRKLDKGRTDTLVVIMAHSYWSTGNLSSFFTKKVREFGDKTVFFADEIHTFMTSCWQNYKSNMGHGSDRNSSYNASFYKKVAEIASYTPHVWGLTATPTAEQLGRLNVGGKMKYRIINENCPKELIKDHNAFYRNINFVFEHTKPFCEAIDKLVSENEMLSAYDLKKTMLVKCTYKEKGADTEFVKNFMIEYIKANGYFSSDEMCIAVMTQDEKYIMSTNGSKKYLDDQSIKDALNDPKHPATFVLVVQKGNAGMNVHTLKYLVSFRFQNYENGQGDFITHNARQLMGRLVRLNGKRTDNNEQAWIIANSIDMVLADTDMMRDAVQKFKEDFFSIDEMSFEYEKEEEMVCCEVCNGTGKVKATIEQIKQSLNNSTVAKFFSDVVKS